MYFYLLGDIFQISNIEIYFIKVEKNSYLGAGQRAMMGEDRGADKLVNLLLTQKTIDLQEDKYRKS